MQAFTDAKERTWLLAVNSETIERVRAEVGVDLLEYGMQSETEDPREVLQFKVRADPVLLCKILYSLIRHQAEAIDVGYTQFAEAMTGQALWESIAKLEEDVVNFTLSPELREAKRLATRKLAELLDKTHRMARETVERTVRDPRIDSAHERELRRLADKSTSLLESLDSTLDQEPGAN